MVKQQELFNLKSFPFIKTVDAKAEVRKLENKYADILREDFRLGKLVSYVGNKEIPILRLYRYKEAFAFGFVEEIIARFGLDQSDFIFDPFCGMGTTLFTAARKNISSIGIDRLPIAVFIAQTLPLFFKVKPGELRTVFELLAPRVDAAKPADIAADVAIMDVAFPPEILITLRKWKNVIDGLEYPYREIFLLLFFSILEACSFTSKDGQFLRLKREKRVADPTEMLAKKVSEAEMDIQFIAEFGWDRSFSTPTVLLGDTRSLDKLPFARKPTAMITSPPYANRYDYTRTYSLELCFHFVKDFAELRDLRHHLLRSHIESRVTLHEEAPHPAVREMVSLLKEKGKALNNPRVPDMLTAYFIDMKKAIHEWTKALAPLAKVALVVDNVRFGGELLPVDLVLSEMAEEEGFRVEEILVARYKGNSSQQMGKYGRVPVRESVVIWRKS